MKAEEIRRRLDRADAAACLALGRTKALEYAIRFIIAVHPDPEIVEAAWQRLLVQIADEHAEAPEGMPDVSMYDAGIQQGLAAMTRQLELACHRPPRSAPDDPR